MSVLELTAMTWEEVRDLDRAKAVAILPTGALEAHGPHLPLGTDVIIAEAMARRAAEKLSARGYHAVLLPPLEYTAAEFAAGFPGTVSLHPSTVTALVLDVASSLGRHGFPVLAIANAHLDPAHVASIEAALAARGYHLPRIVFPDVAKKPWALRLTEEFRSGACHAGRYESSVVLAARPDLVREAVRRALPANPRSLVTAIRSGQKTFEEAGGPRGYFGYPADAGAEEGALTIDTLGSILEEAVLAGAA
jgi:creatinine amidohydrolase